MSWRYIVGAQRAFHKTMFVHVRRSKRRECPSMFSQASPLLAHWGSIGYTSRSHIDDNDKYGDGDDDGGTEDSGRMGLKILIVFWGRLQRS